MEKINLLITDDEQIVLDSIKKHLRNEEELNIFTAYTVNEALDIMNKNDINIILTDLMMPEIDGLEFLKIIHEKDDSIITIMITGYATINSALQAMQFGAFDYIAKPFTRNELKQIVRRAAELVKVARSSAIEGKQSALKEDDAKKGYMKGIGQYSWIMRQDDGLVLVGVERAFLISMGNIQTVYLPSVNDELRQGSVYFQVFTSDLRSQSILSPLSGIVKEINKRVIANPMKALEDPYGSGWLIKIFPTNFDEEIKLMGL